LVRATEPATVSNLTMKLRDFSKIDHALSDTALP
jgi:hypothetical protein